MGVARLCRRIAKNLRWRRRAFVQISIQRLGRRFQQMLAIFSDGTVFHGRFHRLLFRDICRRVRSSRRAVERHGRVRRTQERRRRGLWDARRTLEHRHISHVGWRTTSAVTASVRGWEEKWRKEFRSEKRTEIGREWERSRRVRDVVEIRRDGGMVSVSRRRRIVVGVRLRLWIGRWRGLPLSCWGLQLQHWLSIVQFLRRRRRSGG